MRVRAAGTWVNATGFDVVLRMSSAMSSARVQSQVEPRQSAV
jgi:hypothetical protein